MYKLVKIENGLYHVTKPINDSTDIVIAIITRSGKGYTRVIYHELSKKVDTTGRVQLFCNSGGRKTPI